jgi:isochorismate hydrolase
MHIHSCIYTHAYTLMHTIYTHAFVHPDALARRHKTNSLTITGMYAHACMLIHMFIYVCCVFHVQAHNE